MKHQKALSQRVTSIQSVLMAAYESGTHPAPQHVSGAERERFIELFLKEIFPPSIRFGSGYIVDAKGVTSGQLDIVIERPFAPSFCFPGISQRTYLADNVAAVIEVKSNLSSQWKEVEHKVEQINKCDYSPVHNGLVKGAVLTSIQVLAVGYKGYQAPSGLLNRWNGTPINRRPVGALVIESGSFVFHEGLVTDGGGSKCQTSGAQGIFAFAAMLNNLILKVLLNLPNLMAYCTAEEGIVPSVSGNNRSETE